MPARTQKGNRAAGRNMPPPRKTKKGRSSKTPRARAGARRY